MYEIDWKWCPRVAANAITRDFLISQARLQKAQKTLEAYGRDLDDLLEMFAALPFDDVIEAESSLLELYIDSLYNRPPKCGASSQPNITRITKTRLSLATIRRRVGTARRFYQWLIDRRLRRDLINPVSRGTKGVSRGPVPAPRQEPWIPDDDIWERILRHFLEQESLRNQVLLLVCYDGALRREECLRLRVEDIDDTSLTIIPLLCKVAGLVDEQGVPLRDTVGRITSHRARSTLATSLRSNGLSLTYIAKFLGHTDLKTLPWYLREDKNLFARTIRKHNPLNRMVTALLDTDALKRGTGCRVLLLGIWGRWSTPYVRESRL